MKPTIDHDKPANEGERFDWSNHAGSFTLLWGFPIAAILFTNFGFVSPLLNLLIVATAFFWMGMGCIWNARSCGRRHCFYLGPWFILASFIPLCEAAQIFDLSTATWNTFSSITFIGAILLWLIPEKIWGKYR